MEQDIRTAPNQFEEYTMHMGAVNLIALLLIIPASAVILIPYILIWDIQSLQAGLRALDGYIVLLLVGGILVHELLHGITWGFYAPNGSRAIKYGVQWKALSPYCHCADPLKVKHYAIGAAMPLIVLGLLPAIIGIVTGSGGVLAFGLFFTWAAGGDIIALYMLRNLDRDALVFDHPEKMGFLLAVSEPPQNQSP